MLPAGWSFQTIRMFWGTCGIAFSAPMGSGGRVWLLGVGLVRLVLVGWRWGWLFGAGSGRLVLVVGLWVGLIAWWWFGCLETDRTR